MQLSHVGTFKALKDRTFMSVNGMRYSGLISSTGNCLQTGYDDLCRSRTACGQDMLTCASVRQRGDREDMLTCASLGLFLDRIC